MGGDQFFLRDHGALVIFRSFLYESADRALRWDYFCYTLKDILTMEANPGINEEKVQGIIRERAEAETVILNEVTTCAWDICNSGSGSIAGNSIILMMTLTFF